MTRTDLRIQRDGEIHTTLNLLKESRRITTRRGVTRILSRFQSLITRAALRDMKISSIAGTAIIQEEEVAEIIIIIMEIDDMAASMTPSKTKRDAQRPILVSMKVL